MDKKILDVNIDGNVCGENHHRAKLSDRDVRYIRELSRSGKSAPELAVTFDCAESTIRAIVTGARRSQPAINQRRRRGD